MVPHKTARGVAALERMKVFEGVPAPYDKVKRMVVPDALQPLRLQKGHKCCALGDLSTSVSFKGMQDPFKVCFCVGCECCLSKSWRVIPRAEYLSCGVIHIACCWYAYLVDEVKC